MALPRLPPATHAGIRNSLFRRKFSLFGCAWNSIKEANQYSGLRRRIRANNAQNRENFPVFSLEQGTHRWQ
jgi:hypothetical protein